MKITDTLSVETYEGRVRFVITPVQAECTVEALVDALNAIGVKLEPTLDTAKVANLLSDLESAKDALVRTEVEKDRLQRSLANDTARFNSVRDQLKNELRNATRITVKRV